MIKICIAGKNNIAVNSLQFILKNYFEADQIVVIPNKNDKGIDSWQKSLLKFALDSNIKIVTLDEIYNIEQIIFFL
nr:hypothetical protein [Campylobacter jejuni]